MLVKCADTFPLEFMSIFSHIKNHTDIDIYRAPALVEIPVVAVFLGIESAKTYHQTRIKKALHISTPTITVVILVLFPFRIFVVIISIDLVTYFTYVPFTNLSTL